MISDYKSILPMQGAQVRTLSRELDPTCHTKSLCAEVKILIAAMKIEDPECHNEDPAQPSKYTIKEL